MPTDTKLYPGNQDDPAPIQEKNMTIEELHGKYLAAIRTQVRLEKLKADAVLVCNAAAKACEDADAELNDAMAATKQARLSYESAVITASLEETP